MARHTSFKQRWREFWSPPDQILIDAGANGEALVAWVRVVLTAILLGLPLWQLITRQQTAEMSAGLGVAAVAVATASIIYLIVRVKLYRPWLGFVTSLIDISFVTAALITYLALDQPHMAVNSKLAFPVYFLAIGATALRYDARISALIGLIAVLQYSAVVSYTDMNWTLNDPSYAPFAHGTFSWNSQIGRLVLLLCAGFLATAVVRRTQHLRWLSASDPLTHLMNRGFFDERLEEEGIRARRYKRQLSIVMIDIDRFKQFNDTHGHAAGDDALCLVAEAIRATVRRTDLVARYGGEEFVVAFPETAADRAILKAQDIREAIATKRLNVRGKQEAHVTASLGVACWPSDGEDLRSTIEVADDRLYEAKQAGRDRVVGPRLRTVAAS